MEIEIKQWFPDFQTTSHGKWFVTSTDKTILDKRTKERTEDNPYLYFHNENNKWEIFCGPKGFFNSKEEAIAALEAAGWNPLGKGKL